MPKLTFQFSDVKEIYDPSEKSVFNPYGKRAECEVEGAYSIRIDALGYDRNSVIQFIKQLNSNPDVVTEDDVISNVDSEDQWILSRVEPIYDIEDEAILSETNMLINIHISSKLDVDLPDIVLDIDPPINEGIRHAYSFTWETGDERYIDITAKIGGVNAELCSGAEYLIDAIDPLFTNKNDAEYSSTDERDAHSQRVTQLKSFLSAAQMDASLSRLTGVSQTVSVIKSQPKNMNFPAFNKSYLLIITGKKSNIANKYLLSGRIRRQ